MRGVCLCDDGIAGCDSGCKIPSRNAIERKWKIVRTKDTDRADGLITRTDIRLGVDGRYRPALLSCSRSSELQLIDGSRHLHVGKSR